MKKYTGLKADLRGGVNVIAALDASENKNREERSVTRGHQARNGIFSLGVLSAAVAGIFWATGVAAAPVLNWATVANNGTSAPDLVSGEKFFSYNQPSINDAGLLVFRARARAPVGGEGGGGGGGGEPVRGVFARDMSVANSPVTTIASNKAPFDVVPAPNNITNPGPATFNEFPAFPRIDARSSMAAFRGQSTPAFEYQTGVNPDGTAITTRGGTSGVYTNPTGPLITGASLLGNVNNAVYPSNPDLSYFQVPGTTPGTKFDQFPGSPTATGNTVAFKGNWTDSGGVGQTGIYYRDVIAAGGRSPVYKIAASGDAILDNNGNPVLDGTGNAAKFGSTAPPSASDGRVVFTGLDNEDAPTAGGIFVSSLADPLHKLKSLVSLGVTKVGDALGSAFKTVGEGLSFDGKNVGFWGSWGDTTRAVTVKCSSDGNAAIKAACLAQDTNGTAGDGIYDFAVPEHQGIFMADTETGAISMMAQAGLGSQFADFLFWTFSGAPEDSGGDGTDDREPPRWRSSAFVAVDDFKSIFKALSSTGKTGLYGNFGNDVFTILETGMDGSLVDANAAGMEITSLGIERDGFRNGWLAINAGMANAEESWSGVYVSRVPEPSMGALMVLALGVLALSRRRRAGPSGGFRSQAPGNA